MIQKLPALIAAIWFSALLSAASPLLDIDFGKTAKTWNVEEKGLFRGPLPSGVLPDFPGWNSSRVLSEFRKGADGPYHAILPQRLDFHILFQLENREPMPYPGYYRVEIRYRLGGDASVWLRRPIAPCYPIHAMVELPYSKTWTTLSVPVAATGEIAGALPQELTKEGNLQCILSLGGRPIEIASVKVLPSTLEEYVNFVEAQLKRAPEEAKNYLANSRFPLGIPSGWRGVDVGPAVEAGPSGFTPLRLGADGKPGRLFSAPFLPPKGVSNCILSFRAKGTGKLQVVILNENNKAIKADAWEFPAPAEWERCAVAFRIPDNAIHHGFTVCIYGNAQIDAVTVADARQGAGYASAGQCEVALAPGGGELAASRLQFSDEPSLAAYRVMGTHGTGAVLKGRVVNVYGEEKALPDISLSGNNSGTFDYGVFREKPLGAFRLETWVEENGKLLSPVYELVMTRIRRPVYENRDAPDSPFGDHVNASQPRLSLLKAAGVNHIRIHDCAWQATCWSNVEPEKGKWTINDKGIDEYRRAHMLVLGWLGGVPQWAAPPNSPHDYYGWGVGWGGYYSLTDEEAYREYIRKIVSHYRGRIREWHPWNEPWFVPHGAEKFARLQKIAYEEIKKIAPEVDLVGFSTVADYAANPGWTAKIYQNGGYLSCDSMDYHIYVSNFVGYPGDSMEKSFQEAWSPVLKNEKAPQKPIYMSEGNWNPTRIDGCGIYNHSITWKGLEDSLETSNGCVRFHIGLFLAGVQRVYLYSDAFPEYTLRRLSYPALLQNDGYPRPTLAAYSNMAWLLEDRKIIRKTPLTDGVWSVWFSGKGKTVAVITGKQSAEWSGGFPQKSVGYDLFGNPLTGKLTYDDRIFYLVADDADRENLPGGELYRQ